MLHVNLLSIAKSMISRYYTSNHRLRAEVPATKVWVGVYRWNNSFGK